MYYANCEWYVNMGKYNKPLCERKGLRPAKCSECPVYIRSIEDENARLRELVRGLHMAYVGAINKCESLDESLIWKYSGSIEDDVAKSKAEYESDRHRFDVAMRVLGMGDAE